MRSLVINVRSSCVAVIFAWTASTLAAEPTNQNVPSSDTTSSPSALELLPGDSFFVAYLHDVDAVIRHPVAKLIGEEEPEFGNAVNALDAGLDGEFALSISGVAINPFSWKFTIVARTRLAREDWRVWLSDSLAGVWESATEGQFGGLMFTPGDTVDQLIATSPFPLALEIATRDGLVFASNSPGAVESWLSSPTPSAQTSTGGWRQHLPQSAVDLHLYSFLDLRPLMPLIGGSMNQQLPKLFESLQLDLIENVAVVLSTSSAQVTPIEGNAVDKNRVERETKGSAPTERTQAPTDSQAKSQTASLKAILGVPADKPGPWRALAPKPTVPSLASYFPPDIDVAIHGSHSSLAQVADDVLSVLGGIDKRIADEYEQDRAEFRDDVGFDSHSEILSNFVDEWAVGFDISEAGSQTPLFAFKLADETKFRSHFEAARRFFDLKVSNSVHAGTPVYVAERQRGQFAFSVVRGALVISQDVERVKASIDAAEHRKSLADTKKYKESYEGCRGGVSRFAYFNFAAFVDEVRGKEGYELFAGTLDSLAATGIGVYLRPVGRTIEAELQLTGDVVQVASSSLAVSMRQARKQAQRQVSMANIKGLMMSCLIYANENKNQWPGSLKVLVDQGAVTSDILVSPYDRRRGGGNEPYYLYRPPVDTKSIKEPSRTVVICEPELHDGGANFGFLDGHVEWVEGTRATELLRIMKSGR